MELTAKEILRKHVFNLMRPSFQSSERTNQIVDAWLVMTEEKEAILAAMKEACIHCVSVGINIAHRHQELCGTQSYEKLTEEYMNSLFPESKTETSTE